MSTTTIDNNLLKSNTLFVGERNSGKTTILKQIVHLAINSGYRIIVLDSATDHTEKSILRYVDSYYDDCLIIESPEKNEILEQNEYSNEFPFDIVNSSCSNIILVDVSRYLEEGFLFEDSIQNEKCRFFYKQFVFQCLSVIYNLLDDDKWIVVMDEIEFITKSIELVKKFNTKKIFFVNCLHNLNSCNKDTLEHFTVHQLDTHYPDVSIEMLSKPQDMLCGSACLHFYLNCISDKRIDIPKQLFWIAELGNYLAKKNIKHTMSCYNSNLYKDYKSGLLKTTCPEGYKALSKYENNGCAIVEKQFMCEYLTKNVNPNKYLIVSIQSRLLFNESTRNGYHYIVVHLSMDKHEVISPSETGFLRIDIPTTKLVDMIVASGSWVISIY